MNSTLSTLATLPTRAALAAEDAARTLVRSSEAKLADDSGMTTIEYAFGSLAAAALAGVLYMVVNGNGVMSAIEGVITNALSNTPR